MKVKLIRQFSYQAGPNKVVTHDRGIVDLPERYALAALRQRAAVRVEPAKKKRKPKGAPENKLAGRPENKAGVGRKARGRRGTGSKS